MGGVGLGCTSRLSGPIAHQYKLVTYVSFEVYTYGAQRSRIEYSSARAHERITWERHGSAPPTYVHGSQPPCAHAHMVSGWGDYGVWNVRNNVLAYLRNLLSSSLCTSS